MIRRAYYDLTSKLVFQILTGNDGDSFPLPEAGNATLDIEDVSLQMPLYVNGSEAFPLPDKPNDDYTWDPLTLTWVTDLYATGEERGRLILLQSEFFWHRGFWLEMGGAWKEIICDDRNVGRIRDAAILASLTAPGDPFSAIILINENAVTVTRSEALAVHAGLITHSSAVDNEILRMQAEVIAAYELADTDLSAGIAAMQAILWTYIPIMPDED